MKMTNIPRSLFACAAVALLAACSTYSVSRYSVSTDDVFALRKLSPNSVSVGTFTSEQNASEMMCRGVGPIKTPDGEPYAEYVRRALISELKIAGAYSDEAPLQLTGSLNRANFSSGSGVWNLVLALRSSNGRTVAVTEDYKYTTSFGGDTACNQTAQALMPAVQDLLGKAIANPQFAGLVTP
jgi:hypothetical protein